MTNQLNAKIRVCARCERVFIFHEMCPHCGFCSYGAIWAIGFCKTIYGLIFDWMKKPSNKDIIIQNKKFYE